LAQVGNLQEFLQESRELQLGDSNIGWIPLFVGCEDCAPGLFQRPEYTHIQGLKLISRIWRQADELGVVFLPQLNDPKRTGYNFIS